ncbi:calcium/sodium antiporter [Methanopyrus sp.]
MLAFATALCWMGSELLVSSLITIGETSGIPESVLGVLVSAPGTSLPEFGSSLVATLVEHKPDVGVGCVVGSNVYNLCGILGIATLVTVMKTKTPIEVSRYPAIDAVVSAGVIAMFIAMTIDGMITKWDGVLFFVIYCIYAYALIKHGKTHGEENKEAERKERYEQHTKDAGVSVVTSLDSRSKFKVVTKLVVGIGLFVISVRLLVKATIKLSIILGYPSALLGYTILAIATSLPETFTTISAAVKGHGDLAVTNILGSNNFNILMGIGIPSLFGGVATTLADRRLTVILLTATLAALPFIYRRRIGILFSLTMFAFYGLFIYYTVALITH